MSIRTRLNLRGLRDIRTHAGKVQRVTVPYMAYMKISCLEMERARREREKRSAQSRIDNINSRLAEIDSEKDTVLRALGERGGLRSGEESAPQKRSPRSQAQSKDGFKIRY
jgi:hypothetical protein